MKDVDYKKGAPPDYFCSECKSHGVKLWRQYQVSESAVDLLCGKCGIKNQTKKGPDACVPENEEIINEKGYWVGEYGSTCTIGWLVPAIPEECGDSYWGYTAIPKAGAQWWYNLPTRK